MIDSCNIADNAAGKNLDLPVKKRNTSYVLPSYLKLWHFLLGCAVYILVAFLRGPFRYAFCAAS